MLSMAILQQAGQLSPHIPMGSSQPALLHRPQGRTDLLLKLPALAPQLMCLWESFLLLWGMLHMPGSFQGKEV